MTFAALAAGAANLSGLAAMSAVSSSADPHFTWAAEAFGLIRYMDGAQDHDDDESNTLVGKLFELDERICFTPARTLAGVREQIAYLLGIPLHNPLHRLLEDTEVAVLTNALAILDQHLSAGPADA